MTTQRVRAISIRQPYVERILRGTKTMEFRSRPTNVRGTVLLYASKTLTHDSDEFDYDLDALPRGKIVGQVDIVDCLLLPNDYGYKLANPVRFDKPLDFLGRPQPLFWFAELLPSGSSTPSFCIR